MSGTHRAGCVDEAAPSKHKICLLAKTRKAVHRWNQEVYTCCGEVWACGAGTVEEGGIAREGVAMVSSKFFISLDQRVLPVQYPGL